MAWKHILFCLTDPEAKSLPSKARHILLVLARHADGAGTAWPSWEALVDETGIPRSTLARFEPYIHDLLTVDGPGFRKSCHYIFPAVDELGNRLSPGSKKVNFASRKPSASYQQPSQNGTQGVELASQNETRNGPKMGLDPSQNGTCTRPKMGPEITNRNYQEISLSLLGSQNGTSQNGTVDNSAYDGSHRPMSAAHYEAIRKWAFDAGLSKLEITRFISVNQRSDWKLITDGYGIREAIAAWVEEWRAKAPDEFAYERERRKGHAR